MAEQADRFIDEYYLIQSNSTDFNSSISNKYTSLFLNDREPVEIQKNKHIQESE